MRHGAALLPTRAQLAFHAQPAKGSGRQTRAGCAVRHGQVQAARQTVQVQHQRRRVVDHGEPGAVHNLRAKSPRGAQRGHDAVGGVRAEIAHGTCNGGCDPHEMHAGVRGAVRADVVDAQEARVHAKREWGRWSRATPPNPNPPVASGLGL